MNNMRSTLAAVWRIAAPYFRSEDKFAGRLLLAAVIAIELTVVGINVLLNQWNNRFYTALQDKSWDAFVREMGIFCILAFAYIGLAVYQLYLNQWLQIRWRKWLTERYLGRWLHGANHYLMQLQGDAADNPDQRIAEDVRMFVDQTLNIGVGLGEGDDIRAGRRWLDRGRQGHLRARHPISELQPGHGWKTVFEQPDSFARRQQRS